MAWIQVSVTRDKRRVLGLAPWIAVWQHNPHHAAAVAALKAGERKTPSLPFTFVARRYYDWWQLGSMREQIIAERSLG